MDLLAESRDKYLQVDGRPERSLARHREVLNAIRSGDRELAASVMLEHLEDIEASLFSSQKSDKIMDMTGKGGRKRTVL
jgi:DNA-binding FadR family transcriptional regulator